MNRSLQCLVLACVSSATFLAPQVSAYSSTITPCTDTSRIIFVHRISLRSIDPYYKFESTTPPAAVLERASQVIDQKPMTLQRPPSGTATLEVETRGARYGCGILYQGITYNDFIGHNEIKSWTGRSSTLHTDPNCHNW